MVDSEIFERWVGETVESLPPFFKDRIDNVLFVVEALPDPEVQAAHPGCLLGLYQGVPLTERSVWHTGPSFPDMITLYQVNIEAICKTEADIKRQIQETVLHEVGHYFGLSEAQMDAIEVEWLKR